MRSFFILHQIFSMNKNFILLFLVCSIFGGKALNAQVTFGGEPQRWSIKAVPSFIPFVETASPDMAAIQAEDAVTDLDKSAAYRFGVEHAVNYDLQNSGTWIFDEANDKASWFLGVRCTGAKSINFIFDVFHLVKGAEMFIWAGSRDEFIGKINERNNSEANVLGTTLIHDDEAVIELTVPISRMHDVDLHLGTIVHGYRSVLSNHLSDDLMDRGPYGTSGACNNNINCPVGADWQVEKKAVALILDGGFAACTGTLVNNTANDGTPYFLTANHCYGATTTSWVFVFNHESNGCNGTTGPTNQTISGCVLRAKNAGSDFCLVELNSTPPASYNVQYAGWDASDANTVSSVVGIHHPSGDIKKISFENDPVTQGTWGGAQTWDVAQWDDGITEPGSSGSPLFDQNHRVIGQLFGGNSACSGSVENGQGDSYGRFGVSWDTGTTTATRLKEWLDPGNTGILVMDGYPEGFVQANLDAAVSGIANVPAVTCNNSVTPNVTLINNGLQNLTSCVIQYQVNGGAASNYNWSGNLAQGATATVTLPAITLVSGANAITVTVTNPNNGTDENGGNNAGSASVNLIDNSSATALPYANALDATGFPYANWQLSNPDNATTWAQTTVAGNGLLKYDCYNYNAEGEVDEFTLPTFSVPSNAASLKFQVAHCQYDNTYDDSLVVMISTDCQNTWTEVYRKGGPDLATIAANTADYTAPVASDFRQECVDLNGLAFATLYVKFKGYDGYGNNIYLDNIEVTNQDCSGASTQLDEIKNSSIQLYPNPSNGRSTLMFGAGLPQDAKVSVYNALGELVHQQWLISNTPQMELQGEFTEGVYMIAVQSGSTISHLRWVVKK
ncbi:MAG: hypothetical protein RLY35_940 [Bacteroidota bacterium]|jgi:V8-like Glu-specific endopeptidase